MKSLDKRFDRERADILGKLRESGSKLTDAIEWYNEAVAEALDMEMPEEFETVQTCRGNAMVSFKDERTFILKTGEALLYSGRPGSYPVKLGLEAFASGHYFEVPPPA